MWTHTTTEVVQLELSLNAECINEIQCLRTILTFSNSHLIKIKLHYLQIFFSVFCEVKVKAYSVSPCTSL